MQEAYEEAVTIARALDDRVLLASALFDLSFVAVMTAEDFEEVERILREALDTVGEADLFLRSRILGGIGYARMLRGEAAASVEPFEQAIELQRAIGDRLGTSANLVGLAGMEVAIGDVEAARTHLREATEIAAESGTAAMLATVVLPNAIVASHEGRHEEAARLVGAWEQLQRQHQVRFPDVALERFGDPTAAARDVLGDDAFERAFESGLDLDLPGIARLAVAGRESSVTEPAP